MIVPDDIPKISLNGLSVSPLALANIACALEQHGSVLVVGAAVHPYVGRGALELGKSFAGYLQDRDAIKAKIKHLMGETWWHEHRNLPFLVIFDAFTADAIAMIAEVEPKQPGDPA